jgi:hypothetical protein
MRLGRTGHPQAFLARDCAPPLAACVPARGVVPGSRDGRMPCKPRRGLGSACVGVVLLFAADQLRSLCVVRTHDGAILCWDR